MNDQEIAGNAGRATAASDTVEREIIGLVVRRFLPPQYSFTPRKLLLHQFQNPEAIDRLERASVLKQVYGGNNNTRSYSPMSRAFQYCGDEKTRLYAKQSLEQTLQILRHLYLSDMERSQYAPDDANNRAKELGILDSNAITMGLYLAQELRVFDGWAGTTGKPHEMTSFTIGEGILKLDINEVWDKEVALDCLAERQSSTQSVLPIDEQAGLTSVETRPQWHPAIEDTSRALFENGHLREAVLNAYICVIQAVKAKSGVQEKEGDSLMNECFGCDGRMPEIQFNPCQTQAEIDEQRGMMYLFKGIVGIRNLHAHTIEIFKDKQRASEYISLASLLMRSLDDAAVKP